MFCEERKKGCASGWEGRWGRPGKSRGMGEYNQNIVYETNLFSIKEKKEGKKRRD